MTSPRTLLGAWGLIPKKQYGQNFLSDPAIPRMIASRGKVHPEDVVLEIGPGLGALTVPLARAARRVIAVEKDSRLIGLLETELARENIENVQVLEGDILTLDIPAIARRENAKLLVFGNLPYNISSQIVIRLIEARHYLSRCVVMFQKELADRLAAGPGTKTYGRISAMLQYCAVISPVATLPAHLFFPKPKIDSEVIAIDFSTPPVPPVKNEAMLFAVIKAAFSKRRKTLKNALATSELPLSPEQTRLALDRAGISPTRRAETLSAAEFVTLASSVAAALQP